MNIRKYIKPPVLRNILFLLVGLILVSIIVSSSINAILDKKAADKETNIRKSFEQIRDELEFNGVSGKVGDYAIQYNKFFNNYSNIIITDESGNIVYKLNDGFVSEPGKFLVIVDPQNGTERRYYYRSAYIIDSRGNIKYVAQFSDNMRYNTNKLREISASSQFAQNIFGQASGEMSTNGQLRIRNTDGASYMLSDNSNVTLSYTYVGSKGLNLFSVSAENIRENTDREYAYLKNISEVFISSEGPYSIWFPAFIFFWLLLPVWTFMDARKREFRAPLWAILTLAANVVGLIVYLVVRPEHPKCVSCGEQLNGRFIVCPYCGTRNKELCASCGQVVEENWVACPYCGHIEKPRTNPVGIDALP